MNGYQSNKKYIDTIDVSSAEYLRPVEIRQDVRQVSERRRVNEILKSRQFREDLERVVVDRITTSPQDKASIKVLQQLSELPMSQARLKHGPIFSRDCTTPICDVSEDDPLKTFKCKLVSCHRILKQSPILISAKTGGNTYLIPSNLPPNHVSASSLVFMGVDGEVDGGVVDGCLIHVASYQARDDVVCVIMLCSSDAVEVSQDGHGLLPLSRQAVLVGDVVELDDESATLQQQIEQQFVAPCKVAMLRGRGFVVVGGSMAQTLITARNLSQALSIQVKAARVGLENVELLSAGAQKRILKSSSSSSSPPSSPHRNSLDVEFEGLLRKLELEGHHTGLNLKGVIRVDVAHINSEVELPPTIVAMGGEERPPSSKQFSEYLNSPMSYKKEQQELAPGTPYHKQITKWVADSGPSIIKLDNTNQFVPLNTDPAELKHAVKMIRKEYYDEKITSGPSSKMLEGPSWQEAHEMRDTNTDTVVMVGAASRGIIQKGHENQGTLYKTYHPPNPFESVTPDDVEAYEQEIQGRKSGARSEYLDESGLDDGGMEAGPDGELVSTEERIQQFKQQHESGEAGDCGNAALSDFHNLQQQQKQQQYQQLLQQPPQQQHQQQFDPPQLYQQQTPQLYQHQPTQQQPAQQPTQQQPTQQQPTQQQPTQQQHLLKEVKSPVSPSKSVSSGENEVLSANENEDSKKKKKKRGFKIPSFSKKKDKK